MTTFTPPSASVTRRVAVGLSAGAQPADGVPELAQSAHEALMRAPWGESPDAPSMPVHDNGQTSNRSVPSGDAFKCGYGYDATNRTERAAAGAVCYSFALPRAMVAETDAAAVTGLTVRVIGDRYLDAGARVFATLTGSAQPPTLAEMLGAEAASAVVCATSGQTKPDGVTPLAPNNRTGVRADAEITPATPLAAPEGATAAYLHVCLALVDYTTTRGAWIEGGAMLAPDTLRVTFDRDVEDDAAQSVDFQPFIMIRPNGYQATYCTEWGGTDIPVARPMQNPATILKQRYTEAIISMLKHGFLQKIPPQSSGIGDGIGLPVPGGAAKETADLGCFIAVSNEGFLNVSLFSTMFACAYPDIAGRSFSVQASTAESYACGNCTIYAFARSAPGDFLDPAAVEVLNGTDASCIGRVFVGTPTDGQIYSMTFAGNCPGGYLQFAVAPEAPNEGDIFCGAYFNVFNSSTVQ